MYLFNNKLGAVISAIVVLALGVIAGYFAFLHFGESSSITCTDGSSGHKSGAFCYTDLGTALMCIGIIDIFVLGMIKSKYEGD